MALYKIINTITIIFLIDNDDSDDDDDYYYYYAARSLSKNFYFDAVLCVIYVSEIT